MTVAIDGFELMRAIGANPGAFSDVRAAVSKSALAVIVAQLKSKSLTPAKLRVLCSAIGGATFALILEHLDTKTVGSLLGKIDKHHPDRAAGSVVWARSRLCAIAEQKAEPTPAPVKQNGGSKARAGSGRKQKLPSPAAEPFFPQSMQAKPRRKQKGTG